MTRHYRLTTADAKEWRAALPASDRVMGSLEFTRIMERQTGFAARLFVVESEGCRIAYPYLLRPVQGLPFADGYGPDRWDTVTPEYTGPLRFGAVGGDIGVSFADLFATNCREEGIVAEFAHLNPWHASGGLMDPACLHLDRKVIYVDLTWGIDRIWHCSLNSDARRAVKQSRRAGVRTRFAESREDVLAFHRLHALTMERRSALSRYLLPPEYFLAFYDTMSNNAVFVLAEYEGRVIAGGLYFHDATDVYWYLSAADMEFSTYRPSNAFHFSAIQWAAETGKKRLLCGAGYQEGDGVFRFKASFSPLRVPFLIYRRVHDQAGYEDLLRAWSQYHGESPPRGGYFPAYRRMSSHDPGTELNAGAGTAVSAALRAKTQPPSFEPALLPVTKSLGD